MGYSEEILELAKMVKDGKEILEVLIGFSVPAT